MSHSTPVLVLRDIAKEFSAPRGTLSILNGVSLSVNQGEKIAIIGPSGSGKSTLLSLIGLLDVPTQGSISIDGVDIAALSEAKQADFRNKHIGFIFQLFELISPFTVEENITAPLEIGGREVKEAHITTLLDRLGLRERTQALPSTLSGGERQRVAIGRALVHQPSLILADEPTGSLDRQTGERVLTLLLETTALINASLVIITHDETIAARMDRVFELRDKTLHERI
jgi:ABC-type lipoprotein export system ATPase subunit